MTRQNLTTSQTGRTITINFTSRMNSHLLRSKVTLVMNKNRNKLITVCHRRGLHRIIEPSNSAISTDLNVNKRRGRRQKRLHRGPRNGIFNVNRTYLPRVLPANRRFFRHSRGKRGRLRITVPHPLRNNRNHRFCLGRANVSVMTRNAT